MSMCEIGFGIDGGGTHSRLCLFSLEDGREIGRFTGGSTNMYSVGQNEAIRNTEALLRSSGVSLQALRAGCLGSAGLSRPAAGTLPNWPHSAAAEPGRTRSGCA